MPAKSTRKPSVSKEIAHFVTAKPVVGNSGYALNVRMTTAEADMLCKEVWIPALDNGTTMSELRAQYGPSERIRRALVRAGRNPIGANRGDVKVLAAKAKKATVIKALVSGRQAGKSWGRLAHESGRSITECRTLLTEAGHGDLANGRVQLRAKKVTA